MALAPWGACHRDLFAYSPVEPFHHFGYSSPLSCLAVNNKRSTQNTASDAFADKIINKAIFPWRSQRSKTVRFFFINKIKIRFMDDRVNSPCGSGFPSPRRAPDRSTCLTVGNNNYAWMFSAGLWLLYLVWFSDIVCAYKPYVVLTLTFIHMIF